MRRAICLGASVLSVFGMLFLARGCNDASKQHAGSRSDAIESVTEDDTAVIAGFAESWRRLDDSERADVVSFLRTAPGRRGVLLLHALSAEGVVTTSKVRHAFRQLRGTASNAYEDLLQEGTVRLRDMYDRFCIEMLEEDGVFLPGGSKIMMRLFGVDASRQAVVEAAKQVALGNWDDMVALCDEMGDQRCILDLLQWAAESQALGGLPRDVLVRVFESEDARVRQDVIQRIGAFEFTGPLLEAALSDSSPAVRVEAACSLLQRDARHKLALSVMQRALLATRSDALLALEALAKLTLLPGGLEDEVIGALSDVDAGVRSAAARVCPRLGDRATTVTSVLRALKDEGCAPAVASLLDAVIEMKIEDEKSVPLAVRHSASTSADVRRRVAIHVGRFGANLEAVSALLDLLRDPEGEVRVCAAVGLGAAGVAREKVVPELEHGLADGDARVRLACARSLWRLTRDAKHILPCVRGLLARDGPDEHDVLESALSLVKEMGASARELTPTLVKLCDSWSGEIRVAALRAMSTASVGEDVRSAVIGRLGDPSPHVRSAARECAAKLGIED